MGAPEIDYNGLSLTGNWEIIKKDSSLNTGHIKLADEIWLMHFLHWWPLTDMNNEISVHYAKDLLLNLWGMQFDLSGVEGKTEINGHRAFFIEGNLGEIVKTRFIVWNCSETNRQFLSDCNINISLNTPEQLLSLQVNEITNSVCCHQPENKANNPKLPQQIKYETQNIALNIPVNWRSDLFFENSDTTKKTPGHYLDGCTEKKGSIWSLLSDSQKEINLIWRKQTGELSVDGFNEALMRFFSDTLIAMQDTFRLRYYYKNFNPPKITEEKEYICGTGNYELITDLENYAPIDTCNYQYKAYLWQNEGAEYLLFASMVSYNNMWGIPFNLAPTEEQFHHFVENIVLENINSHQKFSK